MRQSRLKPSAPSRDRTTRIPDEHSALVPPLPIPNRAVKRCCANDSMDYPCESRSSSGPQKQKAPESNPGLFALKDRPPPKEGWGPSAPPGSGAGCFKTHAPRCAVCPGKGFKLPLHGAPCSDRLQSNPYELNTQPGFRPPSGSGRACARGAGRLCSPVLSLRAASARSEPIPRQRRGDLAPSMLCGMRSGRRSDPGLRTGTLLPAPHRPGNHCRDRQRERRISRL